MRFDPFTIPQEQVANMPSMGPKINPGPPEIDMSKYVVKYIKADLDDPGTMGDLQDIETRGIRGEGIILIKRDSFACMDRFFVVVQYMEETQ